MSVLPQGHCHLASIKSLLISFNLMIVRFRQAAWYFSIILLPCGVMQLESVWNKLMLKNVHLITKELHTVSITYLKKLKTNPKAILIFASEVPKTEVTLYS